MADIIKMAAVSPSCLRCHETEFSVPNLSSVFRSRRVPFRRAYSSPLLTSKNAFLTTRFLVVDHYMEQSKDKLLRLLFKN